MTCEVCVMPQVRPGEPANQRPPARGHVGGEQQLHLQRQWQHDAARRERCDVHPDVGCVESPLVSHGQWADDAILL